MKDLAMYVGKVFYPSHWDYIKEAQALGCCKKVPTLPKEITIGESRVFLLHREYPEADAVLFGYYTIDGIIKCALEQQLVDGIWEDAKANTLTIPAIRREQRRRMPQRGCGGIDPPSYYLVGPDDITAQLGYRSSPNGDDASRFHLLVDFTKWDVKYFRGYKYCNWDASNQLLTFE